MGNLLKNIFQFHKICFSWSLYQAGGESCLWISRTKICSMTTRNWLVFGGCVSLLNYSRHYLSFFRLQNDRMNSLLFLEGKEASWTIRKVTVTGEMLSLGILRESFWLRAYNLNEMWSWSSNHVFIIDKLEVQKKFNSKSFLFLKFFC